MELQEVAEANSPVIVRSLAKFCGALKKMGLSNTRHPAIISLPLKHYKIPRKSPTDKTLMVSPDLAILKIKCNN